MGLKAVKVGFGVEPDFPIDIWIKIPQIKGAKKMWRNKSASMLPMIAAFCLPEPTPPG